MPPQELENYETAEGKRVTLVFGAVKYKDGVFVQRQSQYYLIETNTQALLVNTIDSGGGLGANQIDFYAGQSMGNMPRWELDEDNYVTVWSVEFEQRSKP